MCSQARNVLVAVENRPLLIDFGLACDLEADPPEWLSRTVGTKKYRPPEMLRDGSSATPSMDVYCYGLMLEKLVRQRRERPSSDHSEYDAHAGRHERQDCRLLQVCELLLPLPPHPFLPSAAIRCRRTAHGSALLHAQDLADECTSRVPSERPSAWHLLTKLQRHAGEGISRCETPRERVPLHGGLHSGGGREPPAAAANSSEGNVDSRKRRRASSGAGENSRASRDDAEPERGEARREERSMGEG